MRGEILRTVCENRQSQYYGKNIEVEMPERLRTASQPICTERDCVVYCDNCRNFRL